MSDSFDRCRSAMLGHAIANNCQASTLMAIELAKSLCSLKHYDRSHVMEHYLYLRYMKSEYRMGEVFEYIFEQIRTKISATKIQSKHFRLSSAELDHIAQSAHNHLKGLSAGCNPLQRAYPLALCPWIDDDQLFETSCKEASLTHRSPQANQSTALLNLICRRLIRGDEWTQAIDFAFNTTKTHLIQELKEIHLRYKTDPVLNSNKDSAYAPNVLHTTLHIVTKSTSFEDALRFTKTLEQHSCPTTVGLLAAIRWNLPKSIVSQTKNNEITELKTLAKSFINQWRKQESNQGFLSKLFS